MSPLDVPAPGDERCGEGGSPTAGMRGTGLSQSGSWPEPLGTMVQGTVGFLQRGKAPTPASRGGGGASGSELKAQRGAPATEGSERGGGQGPGEVAWAAGEFGQGHGSL